MKGSKIEILKTPYRAPKVNAICERFLGSVRRECLDHMLTLGEGHLYRVIKEYVEYFNQARPHQGIEQKIPEGDLSEKKEERKGKVIAFPVLNGLHHDYRRAVQDLTGHVIKGGRSFCLADPRKLLVHNLARFLLVHHCDFPRLRSNTYARPNPPAFTGCRQHEVGCTQGKRISCLHSNGIYSQTIQSAIDAAQPGDGSWRWRTLRQRHPS